MNTDAKITAGNPTPLGVTCDERGANVAVFSAHATGIDLCVFDESGAETARIPLPERTGSIWHGHIADLRPGMRYGLRAHGAFDPYAGHRFNPAKLLLDPYATKLDRRAAWHPVLVDRQAQNPGRPDHRDSAPFLPKCVVETPLPPVDPAERPRTPWADTVIYEAHVRALTKLWPDMDPSIQGTYEALGTDRVIAHLKALGVTAIELLPIHAILDDARLVARGLVNHWGYNTAAFFIPEPRYCGPGGRDGLRASIQRLHAAGIEVLLDVVYNHTAEGGAGGPSLSFRGLDNVSYYRLADDGAYINDTGCGNTVNAGHPFVTRLILDSLRWWVERMGVDGFRFDLASALARGAYGFEAAGSFLTALRQDPVLADVKLIAEPWDIGPGGYRLGGFPPPFAEWNDRFRDAVRAAWRRDPGTLPALAGAIMGSASVFDHGGRPAWSSVNFIAAHDGFTLADVTRYKDKHNDANGEDNRDGHAHNLTDNFGVEGPTDDPNIVMARAQRLRNFLATLFASQGTPMLLAGDEVGHSQDGNNNAYAQDNRTTWIDWAKGDRALLDFALRATALRRDVPTLRQARFLHSDQREHDGKPDVEWYALDGGEVDWDAPDLPGFTIVLRGAVNAPALSVTFPATVLAVNTSGEEAMTVLPKPAPGLAWRRELDTALKHDLGSATLTSDPQPVAAASLVVFVERPA